MRDTSGVGTFVRCLTPIEALSGRVGVVRVAGPGRWRVDFGLAHCVELAPWELAACESRFPYRERP